MPAPRKENKVSRRSFLQGSMLVVAGSILAACQPSSRPTTAPTSAPAAPGSVAAATAVPPTAAPPTAAKSGGKLTVGTVGDISNLDPFMMVAVNYPMMETVYDQFVRLTNDLKLQPAIVEEWTPSADGLQLKLKVRRGVKYHDGSTATADDVAKCIQRAMVAETGGHMYANWQSAQEVVATGNDSVLVTLKKPTAYLLPAMGFTSLIRPSAFSDLKKTDGGTGPFKVKEWVPNDYVDFERFGDYYVSGKPKLDSVRLKIYADPAPMIVALEAGTLDMTLSVPPSEYERLKAKLNIVKGQDAANFYYFAMNTKKPPFDKKEVRQALAFAIDKVSMCKNVLFSISDPIDLPWPKGSLGYFQELEGRYKFDLGEAKKRLAAAGLPNGFEFKMQYQTTYPEFGQMAQIMAASLAQIGVRATLVPMDGPSFTNLYMQGDGYEATFLFAGGTQWFPTRIAASTAFRLVNNVCWPNGIPPKEYADGITACDSTLDPTAQREAMRKVATSFVEECWAVPVAFRYDLFGLQKYVQGFGYGVFDQPRYHDVVLSK